jgi:hypothetical protein
MSTRPRQLTDEEVARVRGRLWTIYDDLGGTWSDVEELLGMGKGTLAGVANERRRPGRKLYRAIEAFDEKAATRTDAADASTEELEASAQILGGRPHTLQDNGIGRIRVLPAGLEVADTVPEVLHRVRCLLDRALEEVDTYVEERTPGLFARGGLDVLRQHLADARRRSEL